VEVEPQVLPAGAGVEVGREPTSVVDAGVGAAMAVGVGRWSRGVHHPVLRRSTTGRSCHILLLHGFLMGADCIVCDHDVADGLWKCPSSVECHALLQLGGETDHEAVILLLVRVHLVQRIMCQVVELLGVVMHESSPCFKSMNSWCFFLITPAGM
jgi:hypothetical protein